MKNKLKTITILGAFSLLLTACNFGFGNSNSNAPQSSRSSSKPLAKYCVLWKNYDGITLEIDENVIEGTTPTYNGPTPVKQSDERHVYVFDGWTQEIKPASGSEECIEYFAKYKEETRKYKIIWKNYDGSTLKTDEVPYGETPTYSGETPTKAQTVERTYTFEKWSPEIKEVDADATYTASFKDEARKYQITWKNEDGTVIKTDNVPYGTIPVYEGDEPTKPSTKQLTYKFKEWSPNLSAVTGDAEYTATFESEVRKYTITWKNYDGSILEVDKDAKYGELPTYNGTTPKRSKGQGFEYTFSGWNPSVNYVTADTEYVAQYSTKASFCFDQWHYEIANGHSASEIQGAPWINSNIRGQIHVIKKPSLKDDFFTSVNYEMIKSGELSPFDLCDEDVAEALESIENGTAVTTNGDVLSQAFTKIVAGDVTSLKNDMSNIDVNTFISSKKMFVGTESFAKLYPSDSGYELEYNDGYLNGTYGLPGLYFYAKHYAAQLQTAKNLVSAFSSVLNMGLSSNDISNIASIEGNICEAAYQSSGSTGYTSYTVSTLPWAKLKSALLDLGLTNNTSIKVRNYYKNCFNYLYNQYATNNASTVLNMIKTRMAFENRFVVGVNNYKTLNPYITQTGFFESENYITYSGDNAQIGKEMAKVCFATLYEQAYLELEGDEETKQIITDLIEDILDEYIELANDSWLGSTTKQKMKSKLQHMGFASCYSDGIKNFPELVFANLNTASIYDIMEKYQDAALQAIADGIAESTNYWNGFTSYTVNAFYVPTKNIFVILNGIVKDTVGTSIEERYGMIGAIIGHEITHAFDSTGSQFDENGNYNDWWSSSDKNTFNKKVNTMRSFYNKIQLKKGFYCDGENVDGEATADMGGVKVMLRLAKDVEGFDYEKFFKAFAKVWCFGLMDLSYVESRAEDTHPFNYLRTNVTLAQFDEFIETFDIQPGDGMYIPPEERIAIW